MSDSIFAERMMWLSGQRAIAGLAISAVIAGLSWRVGWLSRSGALAAVASGTLCVAAGWTWGLLLVLYFIAASGLSRAGSDAKAETSGSVVAKGGARDAMQVLANGGVFSLFAFFAAATGTSVLTWGAIGALAASSSDTWSTEIGVGLGGAPRSILTWTYVRPGVSGGVTGAGFLGAAAGAAWIGLSSMLVGFHWGVAVAALVAGIAGSLADSLLGATVQERRRCDVCNEPTERIVHICGSTTRRDGGIVGLNNDAVNLLSTIIGLVLGMCLYWLANGWNSIGG